MAMIDNEIHTFQDMTEALLCECQKKTRAHKTRNKFSVNSRFITNRYSKTLK